MNKPRPTTIAVCPFKIKSSVVNCLNVRTRSIALRTVTALIKRMRDCCTAAAPSTTVVAELRKLVRWCLRLNISPHLQCAALCVPTRLAIAWGVHAVGFGGLESIFALADSVPLLCKTNYTQLLCVGRSSSVHDDVASSSSTFKGANMPTLSLTHATLTTNMPTRS
jgi:hypothetical protein